MMQMLKRVIARLSGTTTEREHSQATAKPTQTAGLAHPEPTARSGNRRSAATTKPQPQAVRKSRTPKSSVAQPTTQAPSRKQGSKPVQTTSGKRGRPRKTTA